MSDNIKDSLRSPQNAGEPELHELFPGIVLSFHSVKGDSLPLNHEASEQVLEISYCRAGHIVWELSGGEKVTLGHGDLCLRTMSACAASFMTLPDGHYEGLTLRVDLRELSAAPPPLLGGTGITGELMYERFCREGGLTALTGSEQVEAVFSGFYDQPEELRPVYWRLKAIEALLLLSKLSLHAEADGRGAKPELQYPPEQLRIAREVHEKLIDDLASRCTIEMLAKQHLINPTTLKEVFKAVYGTSIAAHIKEHRMERAAQLLGGTAYSIAEIAKLVGYESQSKFTAAFKEYYKMLPTEYRKGGAADNVKPVC